MGLTKNMMKLFGMKPPAKQEAEPEEEAVSRWEKAVTAVNGISQEIAKMDPDGIDVYAFSGPKIRRGPNIKDTEKLASVISQIQPEGECRMMQAIDVALKDVKTKRDAGNTKPTSILVLTAGLPQDEAAVVQRLTLAVQEMNEYLSITFVQVGDDPNAEVFLKHLDDNLVLHAGGKSVDIIDTLKDEDIQKALDEMTDPGFKTGMVIGGLLGGIAGMALGACGAHLLDRHYAAKRTAGWNGDWEVLVQPGDTPSGVVLKVVDTMDGNFTIQGYPEDGSLGQPAIAGSYEDIPASAAGPASYIIRKEVSYPQAVQRIVTGTVIDEHVIEWSDNTTWREVCPPGQNWYAIGGGAAAGGGLGAAAGGALGALVQKKFFKGVASKTEADYVLLIDCSAQMLALDRGKGHKLATRGGVGADVLRAALSSGD